MAYYTLCTKDEDSNLHPQFGDKSLKTVLEEKSEYRGQWKIIVRSDSAHKSSVEKAIASMQARLKELSTHS